MCVDQPETLRLYAQAMKNLLVRCPEIETFSFLTQDSGSGFCWGAGALSRPQRPQRLQGASDGRAHFVVPHRAQDAAKQAGHEIEINLNPIVPRQWMLPSFSAEQLDAIAHNYRAA